MSTKRRRSPVANPVVCLSLRGSPDEHLTPWPALSRAQVGDIIEAQGWIAEQGNGLRDVLEIFTGRLVVVGRKWTVRTAPDEIPTMDITLIVERA